MHEWYNDFIDSESQMEGMEQGSLQDTFVEQPEEMFETDEDIQYNQWFDQMIDLDPDYIDTFIMGYGDNDEIMWDEEGLYEAFMSEQGLNEMQNDMGMDLQIEPEESVMGIVDGMQSRLDDILNSWSW